MNLHEERWDLTIAEAGDVRLRDLKTGAGETFTGPRALFDALGLLAEWRDAYPVPDKSHYGVAPKADQGFVFGADAHGGESDGIGSASIGSCDWPAMQCVGHAPSTITLDACLGDYGCRPERPCAAESHWWAGVAVDTQDGTVLPS